MKNFFNESFSNNEADIAGLLKKVIKTRFMGLRKVSFHTLGDTNFRIEEVIHPVQLLML